jgi:predicted dehydrogenase
LINIAVIGYGYWGPNLVRNFAETPGAKLAGVADLNPRRLALVSTRYPGAKVTQNAAELIEDPSIDVIVISTPVSSHYDLAMAALRAGKHVLVEKPLTATVEQGMRLIDEAERRRLVLMVDHTFVYTGAVRKMKEMVDRGDLGRIYYYDSVRVNLGLFQHDVNVMWDLAVHDLSIMDYVIAAKPAAVSATGISHVLGEPENIAYLSFLFNENLIAHIHVNWLAPVKVRRTMLGGSNRMIVYDDIEPSEKIKVYDKGIQLTDNPEGVYQMMVSYRSGDMWAPRLDLTEALKTEADEFVRCVETGATPITDGVAGLRLVQYLEAATLSLKNSGRLVNLEARKGALA